MTTDIETRLARWRDFAMRMARTCWDESDTPPRSWIVDQVDELLDSLADECDLPYWTGWDQYDRAAYKAEHGERAVAHCPCDAVGLWEGDLRDEIALTDADEHWACVHREVFDDDWADDVILDPIVEAWANPVVCCVRAGMDAAYEAGAGVLGFTVGDLRRMYPEGLPEWLRPDEAEYVPWGREDEPGTALNAMPDTMGVAL